MAKPNKVAATAAAIAEVLQPRNGRFWPEGLEARSTDIFLFIIRACTTIQKKKKYHSINVLRRQVDVGFYG